MPKTVMVISHTHWDRQWYRTVQEFRLSLGKMMDKLLHLLREDPDFKVFHMDGQTAIIQDYLDLRPWKREEIIRLIQERRLKIGPWFLQPDTFLVSGEGLIRNLLKGSRYARKMGGSTSVGWLPDSFGHNSQMPQILQNFGIDSFLFSRGLGDQVEGKAGEFIWEAPNGDTVLAILQQGGYYGGGNLAYPFFWGNIDSIQPDHNLALKRLKQLISLSEKYSASDVIPIWNGADHMAPELTLSATIRHLDSHLSSYRVVHGAIEQYIDALKLKRDSLPTARGELRGARYEPILSSVLSSRMPIKQRNYRIERILERLTEPLSVAASILGAPYPHSELDDAWDGVIKNHFHDAICGCSIDQAHKEMDYGFEKAEQTAHELNRWALDHIAEQLNRKVLKQSKKERHINLVVFNPLPRSIVHTREVKIEVPEWTSRGYTISGFQDPLPVQIAEVREDHDQWIPERLTCKEIKRSLHLFQQNLYALENRAIVSTEIRQNKHDFELRLSLGQRSLEPAGVIENLLDELKAYPEEALFNIRAGFFTVRLLAPLCLAPFCYRVLSLQQDGKPAGTRPAWFTPVTAEADCLDNAYLRVQVNPDGSLDISNKATGTIIKNAHRFQDQADRGDTYDFCPIDSENGTSSILSPGSVSVKLTEHGPIRGAFLIRYSVTIPESLSLKSRNKRSKKLVTLNISSEVFLSWDSRFVEFVTRFDNKALDHRFRVYFPSPGRIETVHSDGQFMITKRESSSIGGEDWAALPAKVFPHDKWFAAGDGEDGIAILTEGLPEHAVEKSTDHDFLALTLLRSVGWLSRQDLSSRPGHGGPSIETPDAQCGGCHTFRYALHPFSGEIDVNGILESLTQFDTTTQVWPVKNGVYEHEGKRSFIELQPHLLQTTAIKKSEDGLFICFRFYNPHDTNVKARLSGDLSISGVWRAGADENPRERLDANGSAEVYKLDIDLTVTPHEIVTLLIRPAEEKPAW